MDKQDLELITPTFSDVDPFSTEQKAAEDKYTQLEQAKQSKLDSLSIKNNASLDQDSVTQTDEGYLLSNKNKIYNDLYSGDLNFIYDEVKSQALTQNEDGQWGRVSKDEQGVEAFTPYEGSIRRLYGYNTDDGGFKLGLARGDLPSSDFRYIPGAAEEAGLSVGKDGYGWAPGPEGLNLNKKVMDLVLPYETATAFEGLVHGNKNALNQRLNMFSSEEERNAARERFGSGASEYYNSEESIFDPQYRRQSDDELREFFKQQSLLPEVQDRWAGYSEYDDRGIRIRNRNKMTEEERAAELRLLSQISTEKGTFMSRAGNMVDAFQRTLYKEAVLDFSDWVGEGLEYLTDGAIGWDNGTEEEKTQWVNETFGFRPELANAAYQEAKVHADNITNALFDENKDVEFSDIYELVKIGITTPEMLGDSIGFLGSFFVPIAGWGGKAAKADKAVRGIEASLKAGLITKDAAKIAVAAEKANITALNKLRNFTQKNAGLMQVAAGNVNDQIDEYKKEFKEDPSVKKVAQMFATETMMLGLDRFVDLKILKAPGALKGYKDAFSILEPAGKAKVLAKTLGVAGGLALSMGKEASQEYLQEIGQEFNVKFNFDKTGNFTEALDEAGNVLLDKDLQAKGIMGAGLGAGGAVQFEAVGTIPALVRQTVNTTEKAVNLAKDQVRRRETPETTPDSAQGELDLAAVVEANRTARQETSDPVVAYYAGQGSGDATTIEEAKEEARQAKESIIKGTNNIFNSDDDFSTKLEKLGGYVEIAVAEDPELTVEELQRAVIKGLKSEGNAEQVAEVEARVERAHASGLEFASIKPLTEVAKDVSEGPKGFIAYLAKGKAALAAGNTVEYENALANLDRFYNYQVTKGERLQAGIDQITSVIETKVDTLVKQGKVKTRKDGLKYILDQENAKEKPSSVSIPYSEKSEMSFEIRYSDVLQKLLNPSYNQRVYSVLANVTQEREALKNAYNVLIAKESDTTVSDTTATTRPETVTVKEPSITTPSTVDSEIQVSPEESEAVQVSSAEQELIDLEKEFEDQRNIETEATQTNELVRGFSEEDLASLEAEESLIAERDATFEQLTEEALANLEELEGSFDLGNFDDLQALEEEQLVAARDEEASSTVEKEVNVKAFSDARKALKDVNKRISERRAVLKREGAKTLEELLQDEELASLFEEKDRLEKRLESSFTSKLKEAFEKRLAAFTNEKERNAAGITFISYKNGKKYVKTAIDKVVKAFKPSGFTLADRNRGNVTALTKKFADNLLKGMVIKDGEFNVGLGLNVKENPITVFLFDDSGKLNYNVVEALQAASYEFIVQEASNLLGTSRDIAEIAELFNISEEAVSPEMFQTFVNGGMLYKMAAPAIGEKLIKHLGLEIDSIQNREALATAFGMAGLRALEGELLITDSYSEPGVLKGSVDYVRGLPSMYNTDFEQEVPNLDDVRRQMDYFEDTLGVELDSARSHTRVAPKGDRTVFIHKSEYQEAPKDHQEVVNRLEKTAFSFNSGYDVLVEMFGDEEGNLNVDNLVKLILGDPKKATNKDATDRYKAQEAALVRDIQHFIAAREDVGTGSLFFKWFIAKNQRIHLDSNRLNPQNDKNLARWLVTTNNSRPIITKADIQALLEGKKASNDAVMFVYGIIQAFDGRGFTTEVDKNNQQSIIAAAKTLLEETSDAKLKEMALSANHIGHATLAIANIRKYMDADTSFESDMVLEVDGLTNGFAFRAMQFPLGPRAYEWLEKVGVIRKASKFFGLESMNAARDMEQEDVYISVGSVFQDNIISVKGYLDDVSLKWIELFEELGKLPDFSDKNDKDVKDFIRKLMKSPVMIFNYAAGKQKIAGGLVNDQVMGTGYLSGRGLIDALTEKDSEGNYLIPEAKLVEVFGELGKDYHEARKSLGTTSILSKKDKRIERLRSHLQAAISGLYQQPLEDTLESLFEEQTEVNKVITEAGQFMFRYFKDQYDLWRVQNPEATDEEKTEYLRSIAQVVPGVAGASTDDQINKVTFLKNILEPTDNYVVTKIGGKTTGTNTISRGYGDPGVGPAVLLVLSSDSSTLAKTLNQTYTGKKGFGALPVHDAMVLGINEFKAISMYNLNFYTVNKNYSIINEFENAIGALVTLDPNVQNLKIFNPATRKMVSFGEMQTRLVNKNFEVQEARKNLFDSELKIGQMSGPEGSMVIVNPEQMKEVAKRTVANASKDILSKFKNKKIKQALGNNYTTALARIEKMLEGCK